MSSGRLRIIFLTQYYPPETGAPQARIHETARRLAAAGHDIQVLTAMPNYPRGRVFDGYRRRLFMREEIDGIAVTRAYIYPTNRLDLFRRLANYFSFVVSSILVGLLAMRRADVLICESPPLFLGLSALTLSRAKRMKFVFNVSDLWPETAVRLGVVTNERLIAVATRLERFLYRTADMKTGQSVGICRGIAERSLDGRIALVPNGCDCRLFGPERRDRREAESRGWGDRLIVGYAGLIGLAQGVRLYIEVADRLRNDPRFAFIVAGDGPERDAVEAEARNRGLDNIAFLGFRPKADMPGLVAGYDMTIVPLTDFIPGALPSKLYEIMASETPVILAAEGDPKELVERAEAGLVVPYGVDAAVSAIRHLATEPELRQRLGRNGRAFVLANHDRDAIAATMERVLRAVVRDDREFASTDPAALVWR